MHINKSKPFVSILFTDMGQLDPVPSTPALHYLRIYTAPHRENWALIHMLTPVA